MSIFVLFSEPSTLHLHKLLMSPSNFSPNLYRQILLLWTSQTWHYDPQRTSKTSLELSEVGVRVLKIPVTHEQKGLQQFSTVLESCGRCGLASVTLHSSELAHGLSTQAWEWGGTHKECSVSPCSHHMHGTHHSGAKPTFLPEASAFQRLDWLDTVPRKGPQNTEPPDLSH